MYKKNILAAPGFYQFSLTYNQSHSKGQKKMWTRSIKFGLFPFIWYEFSYCPPFYYYYYYYSFFKSIVNHNFFKKNWCNKRPCYLHIHHHLQLHRGSTMKFDLYLDFLILRLHHCLYNCDWNQYSRTTVSPSTNVSWLEKGTHLIGEICLWYIFKLFKEL